MSKFKTKNHSANTSAISVILHTKTSQSSFEMCIKPAKSKKLDEMITTLNYLRNLNLQREFLIKGKTRSIKTKNKYEKNNASKSFLLLKTKKNIIHLIT